MKSSSRGEREFWWLAGLVLITLGLLIGVCWSNILRWHTHITDYLLNQAQASSSDQAKANWLKSATLWAPYDSTVVQDRREFYHASSQDKLAFQTLANSQLDLNPIYLGNQALDLQLYGTAQRYFAAASRETETAASVAGESAALLNMNNTSAGCDKAHQAAKLDLASANIATLVWYCDMYLRGSKGEDRTAINRLQLAKLYQPAKTILGNLEPKTAQDYLVLAQYSIAAGDSDAALKLAKQAYEFDPNNRVVVEAYLQYAQLIGDQNLVRQLQQKLELIQLNY